MKILITRLVALLAGSLAITGCGAVRARRADADVCAVYAAALDSFPALRPAPRPVSARTRAYPLAYTLSAAPTLYAALKADTAVGPALVMSFDRANEKSVPVSDCFPPGSSVTLTADTIRAGEAGPIGLSAVGFAPDRSRALVEVSYSCGPLCATSALYVATQQDGRWRVSRTAMRGSS